MDIRIFQEKAEINSKRIVSIFNPTLREFCINFNGTNYVALPQTETKMYYPIAELFVKRIVDYMINKKDAIVSPKEREDFAKRVRLYEQDRLD